MPGVSVYSNELVDKILMDIADGKKSFRLIFKEAGIHSTTFFRWSHKSVDKKYAHLFKPDVADGFKDAMIFSSLLMDGDKLEVAQNRDRDFYEINNGKGKIYEQPNNAVVNRDRLIIETINQSQQHRNPERFANFNQNNGQGNQNTYITIDYRKLEVKRNGGFKPKGDIPAKEIPAKRISAPDTMGDGE